MDVFIGTIKAFPYGYEPIGWALCDGRIMNVNQNAALFSLINNHFGGDGRNTFALPDLRGAEPDTRGYCQYYIVTMGLYPPRS